MRALSTKIFRIKFGLSNFRCFRAYSESKLQGESKRAFEIFARVTKTYDKMGVFASLGQQNFWKDRLAKIIVASGVQGMHFLDAAGGQGAMATRILNRIKNIHHADKDFHVTVCDINTAMMNYGKELFAAQNHNPNLVDWVEGSVEHLPFSNETFDAYIISMGIRSIDIDKILAEAYRVMKPGSTFYCLDLSRIENYFINCVHKVLFKKAVPYLGYKIWNSREPFRYYVDMYYADIPTKEKLKEKIQAAGFSQVTYKSVSLGWGAIHFAKKL